MTSGPASARPQAARRGAAEPCGPGEPARRPRSGARRGYPQHRASPQLPSALRTWAGARSPARPPRSARRCPAALTRCWSRPLAAAVAALCRSSAACPGRSRLRVKRRVRSPAMGAGSPALRPLLPARAEAPSGSGTGGFPPAPPARGRCAGRGPPPTGKVAAPPRGSVAPPPLSLAMCIAAERRPRDGAAGTALFPPRQLRGGCAPRGRRGPPRGLRGSPSRASAGTRLCVHVVTEGCFSRMAAGLGSTEELLLVLTTRQGGNVSSPSEPRAWPPGFMRNLVSGQPHRPYCCGKHPPSSKGCCCGPCTA